MHVIRSRYAAVTVSIVHLKFQYWIELSVRMEHMLRTHDLAMFFFLFFTSTTFIHTVLRDVLLFLYCSFFLNAGAIFK